MRLNQVLLIVVFMVGCASNGNPKEDAQLLDLVPKIENQKHGEESYTPEDLYDAINHLKKLLKPEKIKAMKQGSEKDMIQYHFGLGIWMRNNWGLWGGSKLSEWFNSIGIHHPDDMSGIILDSLWRDLNDQPLHLREQVEYYKAYWKQAEESHESE